MINVNIFSLELLVKKRFSEEELHSRRIYRSILTEGLFADKTVGRVRPGGMKPPVLITR